MKIKYAIVFLGCAGTFALLVLFVLFSCRSSDRVEDRKPITSLEEYRELRTEKLNLTRLVHNNDGGDATVFPVKKRNFVPGTEHHPRPDRDTIEVDNEFTIENFLDIRSAGLIGSDVTTLSYCTSRPFNQFTHNTKVGEPMIKGYDRPGRLNLIPELIKLGTDPLEVTAGFARENGFEFFWSHRINDTHDAGHRIDNPFPRWGRFKEENPQYLMGTIEERVPARWSSVDFKHQEIRDLCVEYFTEVCENYDVDGIELDFFRHLFLFGNVARHEGVATTGQLDMITDMLVRIRDMTERVGMEKGKPILVVTRVPDSFEYAKGVGIALEEWMKRGLIDIVVGSGYFRLNPWSHMVNATRDHEVKFYAGFDESRIRDGQHPFLKRSHNGVFRARAAAAWQAGVDGIFVFNEYNTRAGYLSEIGEAEKLNGTNNLYFLTYRRRSGLSDPNFYLINGDQHYNLPFVSPQNPVEIGAAPLEFTIEIGAESKTSDVFVILYTGGVKEEDLNVAVNGTQGSYTNSTEDGLLVYEVPQSAIKPGNNKLMISGKGNSSADRYLLDASILFMRDPDDPDLKELADLCYLK